MMREAATKLASRKKAVGAREPGNRNSAINERIKAQKDLTAIRNAMLYSVRAKANKAPTERDNRWYAEHVRRKLDRRGGAKVQLGYAPKA